jgi:hypothetical protein
LKINRENNGRFIKGVSGNPAGRPVHSAHKLRELRDALAGELPSIIAAILTAAKRGDMAACRILMDRCIPVAKPTYSAWPIELPNITNLVDRATAIETEMMTGRIPPDQAAAMMGVLLSKRQIDESVDLELRISKLEAASGTKNIN